GVAVECPAGDAARCGGFRCDTSAGTCQTQCATQQDCQPGLACKANRCVVPECDPSTAADRCRGFACIDGICRVSCATSQDCASGYRCAANGCERNPQPACQVDGDCPSRQCVGGQCV